MLSESETCLLLMSVCGFVFGRLPWIWHSIILRCRIFHVFMSESDSPSPILGARGPRCRLPARKRNELFFVSICCFATGRFPQCDPVPGCIPFGAGAYRCLRSWDLPFSFRQRNCGFGCYVRSHAAFGFRESSASPCWGPEGFLLGQVLRISVLGTCDVIRRRVFESCPIAKDWLCAYAHAFACSFAYGRVFSAEEMCPLGIFEVSFAVSALLPKDDFSES